MNTRQRLLYLLVFGGAIIPSCVEPGPPAQSGDAGSAERQAALQSDFRRLAAPRVSARAAAERRRLAASGRHLVAPPTAAKIAAAEATGQQLVDSLDIPAAMNPKFLSLTTPDPDLATLVREGYGKIRPRKGTSFLLLSTGRSGDDAVQAEPGTDFLPAGADGDVANLRFQVTVPPGVNRLSFDYNFLSAESPEFVESEYDDTFVVRVTDALGANREVALASVRTAAFHLASETNVGAGPFLLYVDNPNEVNQEFGPLIGLQLDAGTTGFQHVDVPVASGTVTIEFDIRDLGDGILDSAAIIDNVAFSSLEIVDPRGSLINEFSGHIFPEPDARLVGGGKAVTAVAADGVTQVLLRSKVPGPGQVSFALASGAATDGGLSKNDGELDWSNSVTVEAQSIGGKWYAFALYRSPADFNDGLVGPMAVKREVPLTMRYLPNGGPPQTLSIGVVRPPVVVVPDLWSNCLGWTNSESLIAPSVGGGAQKVPHPFTVTCVNYHSSKGSGLAGNREAVANAIAAALEELRDDGVAATRTDVVGHGLGGLLARRYIDEASYAHFNNFNAGTIGRLITVSTPHLGSRLADEIVRYRDFAKACDAKRGSHIWDGLRETLAGGGIYIDNAAPYGDVAVDEMTTTSPIIRALGKNTNPPRTTLHHALVTAGPPSILWTQGRGMITTGVTTLFNQMENEHPRTKNVTPAKERRNLIFSNKSGEVIRPSLIFCDSEDQHDLFATRQEQQGGLADAFTSLLPMTSEAPLSSHFLMQRNRTHLQKIVNVLNAPVGGGLFATSMASPGDLPPTTSGCPVAAPLDPDPCAPDGASDIAIAQQAITIASPSAGTVVPAGGAVSVVIDAGSDVQPESILVVGAGGSLLLEEPPFVADFTVPPEAIGNFSLMAVAFYGQGEPAFAQPVNLEVNVAATLTSIEVLNGNVVLPRPGRAYQLTVVGNYSDGVRRDITRAALETEYAGSSLTPVVTVSTEGLVTAVSPGIATVAVRNGSVITSVTAKVGEPACGDGVLDPGEECDDGNLLSGDACDSVCHAQNAPPNAVCESPSVCNDAGACSAVVTTLGAGSSDPNDDPLSITQSPVGPYAVGEHAVSVSVSDGMFSTQCQSQLAVLDCEKPTINCPAGVTAECTGEGGAAVTPPPVSATDNCGVTVQAPAGGHLPLGSNQLTYTATDLAGNSASCTATATVIDTTPPAITCPPPAVAECSGLRQAIVDPGVGSASDGCTVATVNNPGASAYPLGTTVVAYTAADSSANQSSCTTTVTVRDTTAPGIACPPPTVAECVSSGQASVDPGNASATDLCTDVSVSHPGLGPYPLGLTAVTYTATDEAGNQASCASNVTVQDTTAPSIACPPPLVAECTSRKGAFVEPAPATSSDACTNVASSTGPSPGIYPRGTTVVTYTANDLAGNQGSCTSTINVVDTTPPKVSVGSPDSLWPPDHRYHTVSLDDCNIVVKDACGGKLAPTVYRAAITCVTSDEPDNAPGSGDGNTSKDIVVIDSSRVKLRAERDGARDGRVYNVHFRVQDDAGNAQDGVCSFVVPRDRDCNKDCDEINDDGDAHSVCIP